MVEYYTGFDIIVFRIFGYQFDPLSHEVYCTSFCNLQLLIRTCIQNPNAL